VTAVTEVQTGVNNLWKTGESPGLKPYPNYAQYIPVDYFKAFMAGFPYLWSDRKYWDTNKKELPFDFIKPFMDEYNEMRVRAFKVFYLVLDESMSGWRPKTSKTGGLPHITQEIRKPVDLGTMIRNAVDGITGIFIHHDPVDSIEHQWRKKYSKPAVKSYLPLGENISYATAETLRQVEESKVVPGGWACGDAWFGSVEACVELKKRFNVFSTFIIKQNVKYYPMKILHALMQAR
jgi:hypothetical protein